jgi:uncharacterized MAPEG superfamily protein
MHPFFVNLFKILLIAQGPTPSIDRLNGVSSNNTQNEPFFLGLAAAIAVSGTAPSWGPSALIGYAVCRVLHTLVYVSGIVPQPARAITWIGGSAACLSLGVAAIACIFKK